MPRYGSNTEDEKETAVNKEEAPGKVAATRWMEVTLLSHSGALASGCHPGKGAEGSECSGRGHASSPASHSVSLQAGVTSPAKSDLASPCLKATLCPS